MFGDLTLVNHLYYTVLNYSMYINCLETILWDDTIISSISDDTRIVFDTRKPSCLNVLIIHTRIRKKTAFFEAMRITGKQHLYAHYILLFFIIISCSLQLHYDIDFYIHNVVVTVCTRCFAK